MVQKCSYVPPQPWDGVLVDVQFIPFSRVLTPEEIEELRQPRSYDFAELVLPLSEKG